MLFGVFLTLICTGLIIFSSKSQLKVDARVIIIAAKQKFCEGYIQKPCAIRVKHSTFIILCAPHKAIGLREGLKNGFIFYYFQMVGGGQTLKG